MSRQMSLDKWLIQPRNSKEANGSIDAPKKDIDGQVIDEISPLEEDDQKDLNQLKIAIETTIVLAEMQIVVKLKEAANAINKSDKTDDVKTRAKESLEMVARFANAATMSITTDIETRIEEIAHVFDHSTCLRCIEDQLLIAKENVQARIVAIRRQFSI